MRRRNLLRRLVVLEFQELPVSEEDPRNFSRARSLLDGYRFVDIVARRVGSTLTLSAGAPVTVDRRTAAQQQTYEARDEQLQAARSYHRTVPVDQGLPITVVSSAADVSALAPFEVWLVDRRPVTAVQPGTGFHKSADGKFFYVPHVCTDVLSGAAVPAGRVQLTAIPASGDPDVIDQSIPAPYLTGLGVRLAAALKFLEDNPEPVAAGTAVELTV